MTHSLCCGARATCNSNMSLDHAVGFHGYVGRHGDAMYCWSQTSTDLEELAQFLEESVAAGTEGLIVKTLDSTYEPSRRSAHWLKLKKDYLEGVGDTFDVVVIGAWHGRWAATGCLAGFGASLDRCPPCHV